MKRALAEGRALLGTVLTIPSTEIVELVARCAFQWCLVDLAHSSITSADLIPLAQAAGSVPLLVRLRQFDRAEIGQVLDAGVAGIIVPDIESLERAQELCAAAYFPPLGKRSFGLSRSQGYGMSMDARAARINKDLMVLVQVDTLAMVEELPDILSAPGIGGVLVASYNLSADLGTMGNVDSDQMMEVLRHVHHLCVDAQVPVGIIGMDLDSVEQFREWGYQLLAVGSEMNILSRGLQAVQRGFCQQSTPPVQPITVTRTVRETKLRSRLKDKITSSFVRREADS